MRKFLLSCTALAALTLPASAGTLNVIELANPVPQAISSPCIICGTTVQNPIGFGFNNFDTTGHTDSVNLFSTNLFTTLASGVQSPFADNYTVGELGTALGNQFSFGIAIDVNADGHTSPMILDFFQIIDLGAPGIGDETILFQTAGPISLPDIRNGNGKGDYLITGANLGGVNIGDRIVFRAGLSSMSDGPDSFYLVAQPLAPAVPEASTWAMMLLGFAGVAVFGARKGFRKEVLA